MFRNHEDGNFSLSSSSQNLNDISQFLTSRTMSYSGLDRADEFPPDGDMSDDGSQLLGEKKRRLNLEQVRALEKSFELGNKLGPERKIQLARALGLKPRQISIWFQNRRARRKTKQLEKDYDVLRRKFESIKADNDDLKSQNKELQSQLLALKRIESSCTTAINLNKDTYEGSWTMNGSCNDQNNSHEAHDNLKTTSTDDQSQTMLYNPNYNNKLNPICVFPDSVSLTQLLHSSTSPDNIIQGHRIDNPVGPASNEPFYNIFMSGIQENHDVWPWPEQQNNFH